MLQENFILALPVLLPIFAGLLLPVLNIKDERMGKIYSSSVCIANGFILFWLLLHNRGNEIILFSLSDSLSIILRIDSLTVFYTGMVSILWIGTTVYSYGYIHPWSTRYYAILTILLGAMIGIGFAGNLITLYVFYELMAFLCYPLICHSMKEEDIKAANMYLKYSIFSAALILAGIAVLNAWSNNASFAFAGVLDPVLINGNEKLLLVVSFLLIIGFGTKAGIFPLNAWLPVAHPAAPAPFSALLSALITKTGVIGIIRSVYYVVGVDYLHGTWVQTVWIILALITIFIGSLSAFREPVLKRRLAYSSCSQISYILFGLSIMTVEGFSAALLHLQFHAFAKTILFLCAGAIIHSACLQRADELCGIGKHMPAVMWSFTLASFSLMGVPPMGGFISKWHLIVSSLEAPLGTLSFIGPVILLISAVLTAGYLMPVVISAFFPGDGCVQIGSGAPDKQMTVPIMFFVAVSIILAIFPRMTLSLITEIIDLLI